MKNNIANSYQFEKFGRTYLFDVQNLSILMQNKYPLQAGMGQTDFELFTVDLFSVNYIYDYMIDNDAANDSEDSLDNSTLNKIKEFINVVKSITYDVKLINLTFLCKNKISETIISCLSEHISDTEIYINYVKNSRTEDDGIFSRLNSMLNMQSRDTENELKQVESEIDDDFLGSLKNITIEDLLQYDNLCMFFLNLFHKVKKFFRCSAGINHLYIDIKSGTMKCCQYSNHVIGNFREGIYKDEKLQMIKSSSINLTKCKECWCKFLCGGECRAFCYDVCDIRRSLFEILLSIYCEFEHYNMQLLTDISEEIFMFFCTQSYTSEKLISTKVNL